jgi:hypothetical protein
MNEETVEFTGCKFLDYRREKYVPETKMNLIGHFRETKVCWDRINVDNHHQKRGRLNNPTACLRLVDAHCPNYEDFTHVVKLSDVDLS